MTDSDPPKPPQRWPTIGEMKQLKAEAEAMKKKTQEDYDRVKAVSDKIAETEKKARRLGRLGKKKS